jgi:hypothetical protein
MERLSRYPLSVILSFLTENEGTSLLLTKKVFAHELLPVFRRKKEEDLVLVRVENECEESFLCFKRKHRHLFRVVPVQDTVVLLARLNTRKYRRQGRRLVGLATVQLARHPFNESVKPPSQRLLRFLDQSHEADRLWQQHGITLLASYPRSGNTLLRTLFERTTGYVTGSDTHPYRALSQQLAQHLVGEGVVHGTPFVKTHWPERVGHTPVPFRRVVLLVRNPYDAFDSYWNMNLTKSHNATLDDSVYRMYRSKFQAMVRNEIQVWCRFHQYWWDVPCPLLLVRFEDLVRRPEHELTRVVEFCVPPTLCGCSSSSSSSSSSVEPTPKRQLNPTWYQRIHEVVTSGALAEMGSYRPRTCRHDDDQNGPLTFKSLTRAERYTPQLLQEMHDIASTCKGSTNWLQRLGYDVGQEFPRDFFQSPGHDVIAWESHHGPCARTFEEDTTTRSRGSTSEPLVINQGNTVRPLDCPFGRAFTFFRHAITKNDENPLPTVPSSVQRARG